MDRPTRQELHRLLSALLDGALAPEQEERLGELLRRHPQARDAYLAYLDLHADLALRGAPDLAPKIAGGSGIEDGDRREPPAAPSEAATVAPPAPILHPRSWTPRRRRFWLAAGVSAVAAGLLLAVILGRRPGDPKPPPTAPEPIDTTVAVLVQAHGAVWETGAAAPRPGAPLQPGWLRLKSGLAHIEFYCGAIVILQGPAELQLVSRTEAFCARGKLRASVPPPAQGFTVRSPKLDLVDRGTEFGLDVGAATEVHVFKGKVDLHGAGGDRKAKPQHELETGQGLRVDGPGGARAIAPDPAGFVTPGDLAQRVQDDLRQRQERWRALSKELRADPTVLVYYTFEPAQPWSRTLLDQANGRKEPRDAAIVGCSWGEGRWPGKKGLEFKRVSDRVRLHVPGKHRSLTLAAWVRVDGLPNKNNSLFMSDGWEPGEIHWQIGETDTLILGVQTNPISKGAHYHAPQAIVPERFGEWLHLAVVYDGEGNEPYVAHYLNGVLVSWDNVKFDNELSIGDAQLGNWDVATYRNNTPIRFLSGCMDEFVLFGRALEEKDVRRLYEEGRSPS
jgi:hypothetical protein